VTDKPPSLRERRAQLTREEILRAARRLFAERGYSRTSVRDIAEAAGVSAQTVYDSVGSKQVLVTTLNDLIDGEAGIGGIVGEAMQSQDPARIVAVPARVTRSILEHSGDVIHALVSGAAAEPELDAVLAEGHRRHVAGADQIVGALRQLGALDGAVDGDSVDGDSAAGTLAALTDVQLALLLSDTYGWSLDRIESWMTAVTRALLLRGD
jgi:AcrR family transcriptional regulator